MNIEAHAPDARTCQVYAWCVGQHDIDEPFDEQVHVRPEEWCEWLAAQPMLDDRGAYLHCDAVFPGQRFTRQDVPALQASLRRMADWLGEQASRLDELGSLVTVPEPPC